MNNFELAKTLFISGLKNFQGGDYLAAETNFRESLKNLPNRVSTMTNLAGALIKLNKLDEAKELCIQAIAIDEQSAESWLNLGLIDKEQSDFSSAAENFKRAITINPDCIEAHNYLNRMLEELEQNDYESAKTRFVSGLSSFQSGDYLSAERCFREALEILPGEGPILTNLAATLIKLNKLDEAKELCLKVIAVDEDSAQSWLNLGLIEKKQSDFSAAVKNFERAIIVNPDYAEAHNNIGLILKEQSDFSAAVKAFKRAIEINPNYGEAHNNLGLILLEQSDFAAAAEKFKLAIDISPDYVEAYNNLGLVLAEQFDLSGAEENFKRAIDVNPDFAKAHNNLGLIFKEQLNYTAAEKEFKRAIEINPNYAEAHNNLGLLFKALDQVDEAVISIRQALTINPDFADAHISLGSVLMVSGQMDEAERSLTKGIELAPSDASILVTVLGYLPYQEDDHRFNQLDSVYAKRGALMPRKRVNLNFAMGKAMEDVGQYDRSFSAYEEGNRLHYKAHTFDEVEDEKRLERFRSLFTTELFAKYASIADSLPAYQHERVPIFIVGMPRSGTTLIEQILSSHNKVFGAGELSIMAELASDAGCSLDLGDHKAALTAIRGVGQKYIDKVWEFAPDVSYITDKMPSNCDYLGLIHLMLPQAKVIHAVRDPLDTCFSCYALNFEKGHEYSYDLEALGRRYLRYKKLMTHWHSALPPGRILDVRYENMIKDTEFEVRRILEYVGLPWDSACLNFHKNKRSVMTASVTQVRKPIYKSSMERWKRFEGHLSPLIEILQQDNS